ncbi:MAG: hypothetical protein ABH808_00415 [Candidatus Kuenenbacteria bacterium]
MKMGAGMTEKKNVIIIQTRKSCESNFKGVRHDAALNDLHECREFNSLHPHQKCFYKEVLEMITRKEWEEAFISCEKPITCEECKKAICPFFRWLFSKEELEPEGGDENSRWS